jgi:hypothetical protein
VQCVTGRLSHIDMSAYFPNYILDVPRLKMDNDSRQAGIVANTGAGETGRKGHFGDFTERLNLARFTR